MTTMHLGDGAYATVNRDYYGQIILTANHHDPAMATDTIHLEPGMLDMIKDMLKEDKK